MALGETRIPSTLPIPFKFYTPKSIHSNSHSTFYITEEGTIFGFGANHVRKIFINF
jgi:hypothetical protein